LVLIGEKKAIRIVFTMSNLSEIYDIISMTDGEIISRIIELESIITNRIISDRTFRASDGDEYQPYRVELKILREMVKHILSVPSCIKGGDPQRPKK
jgi:hypothetical protein